MPVELIAPSLQSGLNAHLHLDGRPLQIIDTNILTSDNEISSIPSATCVATVLYNWHPSALRAFLDVESWFSLTWNLSMTSGGAETVKFEISRIRSQVTFGKLDAEGLWEMVVAYDFPSSADGGGGVWKPNTDESMLGEDNIADADEIERLGREIAQDMVMKQRWETGKGMKHEFFIEPVGAPIDAFGDGIAMNPHWLYSTLDLTRCTTCSSVEAEASLSRCGRCGTAAYCSAKCQMDDWKVHKAICTMTAEDRGKALHLSQNNGLVGWEWPAAEREPHSEME